MAKQIKIKTGMKVFVKNWGAGIVEGVAIGGIKVRLTTNHNGTNAVQTFRASHVEKA